MTSSYVIAFVTVLAISIVFSMFGKGGGALYTPVLVMLGWKLNQAVPSALFLNLLTAVVATVVFARNQLVDFKFASVFLPGTIAGSLIGAVVSPWVPTNLILAIFSPFLLVAGILLFQSKKGDPNEPVRKVDRWVLANVVGFSFVMGVLSSLLGVGGGLIIFPYLVLYMKYHAQKAAGANAYIVSVSSLVGTLGHFSLGHVPYSLIALASVASIIGSSIGSHVTVKASPAFVKVAFAFILWFFSGQIAYGLVKPHFMSAPTAAASQHVATAIPPENRVLPAADRK